MSSPLGPRASGFIHAASGAWNSRNAAAVCVFVVSVRVVRVYRSHIENEERRRERREEVGRQVGETRTAWAVSVPDGARAPVDLLARAIIGYREVVRVELHARLCTRDIAPCINVQPTVELSVGR